ncbi:hypothetical protein ABS234_19835, partial [Acinetobacter baumannii]|uniref:hypothetical protein n=1 Tax=Acinetobacter baumannii TaxID=470 RepID=UPI003320E233
TRDAAEYEALAIALAQDPQRLKTLRARLAEQKVVSPLFDARQFARDMEIAYRAMLEQHVHGRSSAMADMGVRL